MNYNYSNTAEGSSVFRLVVNFKEALWYKLLLNNINGKMYRLILNMYDNIKSCVVYNNCKSDFFRCENGVRHGLWGTR
jgi:hypothetical protein